MNSFKHQNGQYISVNNTELYIEKVGSPNGFPLIFLHSGLGNLKDFSLIMKKMADKFHCIGIESRGHGKSQLGTEPLSYELFENDVITILEKLGISKCFIIGFSDGGIVAYRLAINNPSIISKIVTIGADWNPPIAKLQTIFSSLTAEIWGQKFPGSIERYNQLNPKPDFSCLMKSVIPMWLDASPTGYPGKNIEKIKCETLIIRGDNDIFMPFQSIQNLKQHLPKSNFLNIPFAGHAVHIERCEIVGSIISQFLQITKI